MMIRCRPSRYVSEEKRMILHGKRCLWEVPWHALLRRLRRGCVEVDHVFVDESVITKCDPGACDGLSRNVAEVISKGLGSLLVRVNGHIELRPGMEEGIKLV